MRKRLSLGLVLGLLAGPAMAKPAGCPALVAAVEDVTGLDLTAPPAGAEDGWCVLDGARSSGGGDVRVTMERLRLRGQVAGEALLALELDARGLRVTPALNNRDMPGWLRDLMRLQSAELHLSLKREGAGDRLLVERGRLGLSGGSELVLRAEVAGAELSAASVLTGRVTKLYLEWKNDGRVLRPAMEAVGAGLEPGATGTKAVLAAREALSGLVDAVPQDSLPDESAKALTAFIAALPQGRGRLVLMAGSESGIGAAQLGMLALAKDPKGPEALARLFAGVDVAADWQPGIAP